MVCHYIAVLEGINTSTSVDQKAYGRFILWEIWLGLYILLISGLTSSAESWHRDGNSASTLTTCHC